AYTEGDPATAASPALTVTDADDTNLTGATVQITGNYASGQDVLALPVPVGSITGSFTSGTGTLTLSGTDSVGNYQLALRSVTYLNTSSTPSTASRTVSWVASDASTNSTPATSTITINAVNNAPAITAGGTLNYTENDAPTAIDGTITITDVDSLTLSGAV